MARGRKLIIGAAALAVLSAGTVVGGDLLGVVEPRSWVPTSIASAADDSGSSGSVADPVESPATPSAPPADRGVGEPEAPTLVLAPGAEGMKVRALQVRLAQLAWYLRQPTGTYDRPTVKAVRGFQDKRGLPATGEVDRRTWKRLVDMTVAPTRAELLHEPGPALLEAGAEGAEVRDLEARLRQIAWFAGDVDDTYDATTTAAVRGFQGKRRVPVTGEVDQRTLDLLHDMTRAPTEDELANVRPAPSDGAALDPRCLTGRVLCIDKTSQSLRWVVDGAVQMDLDVRFGSSELPTREGTFSVYRKSRDHVSSIYHTSMPLAMFFSGGQAVHYSPDFAAVGYAGASHGCINVRDHAAITSLFDQVPIGTPVVIYWS